MRDDLGVYLLRAHCLFFQFGSVGDFGLRGCAEELWTALVSKVGKQWAAGVPLLVDCQVSEDVASRIQIAVAAYRRKDDTYGIQ